MADTNSASERKTRTDFTSAYYRSKNTRYFICLLYTSKGSPKLNSNQRGDQYVTLKVEIPKGLNEKQKSLLREFDDNVEPSKYKQSKNFFEKMRELFK